MFARLEVSDFQAFLALATAVVVLVAGTWTIVDQVRRSFVRAVREILVNHDREVNGPALNAMNARLGRIEQEIAAVRDQQNLPKENT